MPINRKYPVEAVMAAIRKLPLARQKRVMFECVMIKGLTDSLEDAETLSRLVRGMRVKVNLIPLNQAEQIPYEGSGRYHSAFPGDPYPQRHRDIHSKESRKRRLRRMRSTEGGKILKCHSNAFYRA